MRKPDPLPSLLDQTSHDLGDVARILGQDPDGQACRAVAGRLRRRAETLRSADALDRIADAIVYAGPPGCDEDLREEARRLRDGGEPYRRPPIQRLRW